MDEQLLEEVLKILKPIDGVTWPSGRPEWNEGQDRIGEQL